MNAPLALPLPDAVASCPSRLGWMQGSPVPIDRRVDFADGSAYRFPQLRWSLSNLEALLPTTPVARGTGAVRELPRAERDDIDALRFQPTGSAASMRWADSLAANYTDGIVVLHRGRIVHERYFGALLPTRRHSAMSLTKSVVGTLAAMLVDDGTLDADAPLALRLPELAASGLADASAAQLLDMRTALDYSEDPGDPRSGLIAHALAGRLLPRPGGYQGPEGLRAHLRLLRRNGAHGAAFAYRTVNTDALGWLLERASGRPLAGLLAERLWQPLGAEHDAVISVDGTGVAFAGGGLATTLRDLARFGEMLRNSGRVGDRQVVPSGVIAAIRAGGDAASLAAAGDAPQPGWSYRAMWWLSHDPHGAFMARGAHGQALYIDPVAEMVVARYASHPLPGNAVNDATSLPAWQVLARHLLSRPD